VLDAFVSEVQALKGAQMPDPTGPLVLSRDAQGRPTIQVSEDPIGKTWTTLTSYAPPPNGLFVVFQAPDSKGVIRDAIAINPGLIEDGQGDIDIDVLVDGKTVTLAIVGRYQGNDPCITASLPDVFAIGSPFAPFKALWLTEHKSVPGLTLPQGARGWVQMGTGWTPVYG
jgi:hypothetical protein